MSKQSKIVLITGCSNGFGSLTANLLAAEGHTVYASMRDSMTRNKDAKTTMEASAKKKCVDLHVIDLDVTDEKSINTTVETIISQSGQIDVLINNAGTMNTGITEAFTIEQVQEQFNTNFFASVRTCRAVLPYMRKQKSGLMIQISSLAGRMVFPFFGIYCASKFAVEVLSETYHYELHNLGIDSVIVEPGPFKTGLFAAAPTPSDSKIMSEYGDLGNMPDQLLKAFESAASQDDAPGPEEIANAINELVKMEQGQRPIRTIVSGNDFGISALNEASGPIQKGIVEAMGLAI